MTLRDHINQNHNGNLTDFGRTQGVNYQQVQRWLKYGCIMVDGVVYKPVIMEVKQ